MADAIVLDIDGHELRVSNPAKVFFPERGETKFDLIEYYLSIGPAVMRRMGGRPTLLQRFPDGAGGKSFFQKRVTKGAPDWLHTTTVMTPNGTPSNALVLDDLAHVAWAVHMGCLGFHPWPFRAASPAITDELRIDLDPQPGTTFDMARVSALLIKELLDELGIEGFVKTTGSRGFHVYVPLQDRWGSVDVRAAAVALARELERRRPDLVTAAWWKEERGERIFIDYNQNAPHKTMFGAWSVRPRIGGQVSTPISWDAVETVDPDSLTIETVPRFLEAHGDPWASFDDDPQDISTLLEWFARDIDDGLMDAPWPPVYPKQPLEPPRVAPSRARNRGTNRLDPG
ncbi:MAG: ATP-dependent DNA ligase [Actinomycetia bacterium]|nr:ATP-dependent DNA ligase [Actinomycetes bacterium]MCP4961032.1 ATP-dependent DNA ligase [Actinomycetes bacterium]